MDRGWNHKIRFRDLLTDDGSHKAIQSSMTAIADHLERDPYMTGFSFEHFRQIPQGDDVVGPVEYANTLLNRLYNYCDANHIWIEIP